ncbi:MAG: phenylacetic acid degradation protein PaaN, partial [Catalinimonas sp.]
MQATDTTLDLLQRAVVALHERTFYAHFPESPRAYPADADDVGRAAFERHLDGRFEELDQTADHWGGEEESPYTGRPLRVVYPLVPAETLIDRARAAFDGWRKAPVEARAEVLLRSLEGMKERFFEIAHATM